MKIRGSRNGGRGLVDDAKQAVTVDREQQLAFGFFVKSRFLTKSNADKMTSESGCASPGCFSLCCFSVLTIDQRRAYKV